jgi:hypothetical protein
VLARLTFDGRIPREQTVEFLDRIEREGLIDGGDMVWWGWEQAVVKLGLAEFEPALRRIWKKPIYQQHTEADHATVIEMLKRVAANPADSVLFDIEGVRAIDDPIQAVSTIEWRTESPAGSAAEHAAQGAEDEDVARAIRLTEDEHVWLGGLLVSRQVPIARCRSRCWMGSSPRS